MQRRWKDCNILTSNRDELNNAEAVAKYVSFAAVSVFLYDREAIRRQCFVGKRLRADHKVFHGETVTNRCMTCVIQKKYT